MSSRGHLFFIECYIGTEKSPLKQSFFLGPYATEVDAQIRSKNLPSPTTAKIEAFRIRAMRAEFKVENVLVEGTRTFSPDAPLTICSDGSIKSGREELFLPNDYFESSGEFV